LAVAPALATVPALPAAVPGVPAALAVLPAAAATLPAVELAVLPAAAVTGDVVVALPPAAAAAGAVAPAALAMLPPAAAGDPVMPATGAVLVGLGVEVAAAAGSLLLHAMLNTLLANTKEAWIEETLRMGLRGIRLATADSHSP